MFKLVNTLNRHCCCLLLALNSVTALAAQPARDLHFGSTWDGLWQTTAQAGLCQLGVRLGDFGEARFVADAHSTFTFELQAYKDLFAARTIQVLAVRPPWLVDTQARNDQAMDQPPPTRMLGRALHIPGGGAIVRGDVAAQMLWALRQGHHVRVQAGDLQVDIKALGLPGVVDDFMQCARTEVSVAWQAIARTRITYGVNESDLSAAARATLTPVITFVRHDPSIKRIFVDGHTDATGDKRSNYKLSKQRAETVAAYLRQQGLGDRKIVVRFHGATYPVTAGKTGADAALNRRTTVRLGRHAGDLLAGP
ncbi:MAG: OmpA family protein [Pseudomonadota bacterium]